MTQQGKQQNNCKHCIIIAGFCFVIWCLVAVVMIRMLVNHGFEQIILKQPLLFFSLLAVSVFLLATAINHFIRYFQMKNIEEKDQ